MGKISVGDIIAIAMSRGGGGLALANAITGRTKPQMQRGISVGDIIAIAMSCGGGTKYTISGEAPLSLVDAVAGKIKSLTQYGKCSQASTPAPDAPVDIYCNNGKIIVVDDELPSGYKRVLGFKCNNNAMWEITDFHLQGSDTVRISFSIGGACNVFGCYQGADASDNYDLYASVSSGSKYLRYSNGTYLSYWSNANLNRRFDVVYTPNGTTGMPEDSTWTPKTFTSANDLLIGSTTLTGTSSKMKGNFYEDFIVENDGVERLHLVPCERVSDNVLGYYDLVGESFYGPYTGYDGAVSLGYDGSHYRLQVVGTSEVLTVSGTDYTQTASVVNLFAAGTYKDEQEIIAGVVTRKVGVKVFDGTEVVNNSSGVWTIGITDRLRSKITMLCSHYPYSSASAANAPDKSFVGYSSQNVGFKDSDFETNTAFKAWLKDQYDAGTPVILIYPLAEETTEQETAQPLNTIAGTNVVSVVANVSEIELSATYLKK